jgi:NADP-dependent 3-hydroxy acid dehydrogenase YdfG
MTAEALKITALTPARAAKILASAFRRRIDEEQVRQVAEDGQLLRADGTFSLIEYVAYLAGEATRGGGD